MSRGLMALRGACVLGLALGAAGAGALDVGNANFYGCMAGNCVSGTGTAHSLLTGVRIAGAWQGAKTVAGQPYELSHPALPGRTFRAVYGADGLQVSGDMLFALGLSGRGLPVYSGTYEQVDHPFARFRVSVPKRGQLDTGRGYRYAGRFEYLPSKDTLHSNLVSGTYIFFGTVTDVDDGSSEHGLFVTAAQPNGMVPSFAKANAAFLAGLQRQYQQDLEQGKIVMAEQESSRRWREVLGVVGRFGMALATGDLSSAAKGMATEVAMNVVNNMLKTDDARLTAEDATNQALQALAADNAQAAGELRTFVSR